MRVRFLETVIWETEGRLKGPVYDAGSEYDLQLQHAQRWIKRGVAVQVSEAAEPEKLGGSIGEAKLSSSPQAAPANEPKTSKPRGRPRKSLSSTTPTSSHLGQTSSMPATNPGGSITTPDLMD